MNNTIHPRGPPRKGYDIGKINLHCTIGLPGADEPDIDDCLDFLDYAAACVARKTVAKQDLARIYSTGELVVGESALFCATGISDSPLLPGVKLVGNTATTHSILMRARSQTVRYIRAVHNLSSKTIHLRSTKREATV